MRKHLSGKFDCGHEYGENGGYNQALQDVINFIKKYRDK
jgi:hypothetical protein